MNYHYLTQLAQYDCNAYGASTYENGQVCAAQTTNTGPLANTGLDIVAPLGAGLLLIAVAIVLIIRNARKSKTASTHPQ